MRSNGINLHSIWICQRLSVVLCCQFVALLKIELFIEILDNPIHHLVIVFVVGLSLFGSSIRRQVIFGGEAKRVVKLG